MLMDGGFKQMKAAEYILLTAVFAAGAFAEDSARPVLSGTWASPNDASEKLVVEQTDSGIHMQELKGNETKADYECKLDGKDCEFKEDGHPAKVSLWFNGPKLVELVTRGRNIVRRRFTLADGGKKLVVEMSAFSNPDKSETVEYTRQ